MNLLTEKENSAGSEGASRASGDHAGREAMVADPEVSERPKRRRFTAEYKLRIVREADACKGDGDIVALLRREGLYSSQLSAWRRQRDEIAKAGLALRKRGRKAKAEDPKLKELERENARLKRRLARVETMLEIPKNLRARARLLLNQKLPDGYPVPSINSSCMRLANFLQPECFGRLHVGRFKSRRRLYSGVEV